MRPPRRQTETHKAKVLLAWHKRTGIPIGHARLYGTIVPKQAAAAIRPALAEMTRMGFRVKAEILAAAMPLSDAGEIQAEAESFVKMLHQKKPRQRAAILRKINRQVRLFATIRVDPQREQAIALYSEGASVEQIAEYLERSPATIQRWVDMI